VKSRVLIGSSPNWGAREDAIDTEPEDWSFPVKRPKKPKKSPKSRVLRDSFEKKNFDVKTPRLSAQCRCEVRQNSCAEEDYTPGSSANGNESYKQKLEDFAKFLGEKFRAEEFKAILDEVSIPSVTRRSSHFLGCGSHGPPRAKQ
jgi:hypothetical protein